MKVIPINTPVVHRPSGMRCRVLEDRENLIAVLVDSVPNDYMFHSRILYDTYMCEHRVAPRDIILLPRNELLIQDIDSVCPHCAGTGNVLSEIE